MAPKSRPDQSDNWQVILVEILVPLIVLTSRRDVSLRMPRVFGPNNEQPQDNILPQYICVCEQQKFAMSWSDEEASDDPEPVTKPPEFFSSLIQGIRARLPDTVYPPSDDTFLVLQSLLDDADELHKRRCV